jgi:hypothetical protein
MTEQRLNSSEKIIIATLAGACFLLHLITNLNGAYGFFRDELYYIACSDHLAFGYVDQPPFSLYLLKVSRAIFGDSLTAIRLVPSLAHALTIVVTGMIVKQLGGKSFAIFLAGLAVFTSLIHTGMSLIYSMNAIDILLWAIAIYLLLKIIGTEEKRYWVWLGVVLGIGLLNKISVLFLGAGIFAGLLFTNRQSFTTRWPYLAGGIAFLIFLPYIVWNATHDWAHLEFIQRASAGKYSGRSHLDFLTEQILYLNPISLPLWLGGLFAFFFYAPLKKFRILGWVYLTAFLILFLNRTSKGEYLSPAYAMLFAAGALWIEQKLASSWQKIVRYAYAGLLLLSFIFLLPLVLPVLSVPDYIAYAKKIGMGPTSSENKELAELPQFYADMFGWKEKAHDVAKVFQTLSPEDQKKCAIYSDNYGRCGAIDFFGKEHNLPKSLGSHNNYWWWGTREYTGEVVLILGGDLEDHQDDFESCEQAGVSTCQYCMPYENNVKIFICRKLKASLKDAWGSTRHYD